MAVIFLVTGTSVVEADEVPAFFLKIAKNMPRVGRSEATSLDRLNGYILKTAKNAPRVGKRDVVIFSACNKKIKLTLKFFLFK